MKIRILHCIETIQSGGVDQRRLTLAKHLPSDIFEQRIICTKAIGPLYQEILDTGVKVYQVGDFKSILDLSKYKQAYEIMQSWQPHIIHAGVYEGVAMGAISGSMARIPIIISEETSDPVDRSWKGHLLFRFLLKLSDYVIGVSPSVREYLLNQLKVNPAKILHINNGVPKPLAPCPTEVPDLMDKYKIGKNDFVVGSVGRLKDSHKRFSDLILAISYLTDKCPNLKLIIVGDGPDKEKLQLLAKQKGVIEKVIFAGYHFKTSPFYSLMNVFSLASHMEAFGLVIVEAMWHKLPIVATRVGGVKDIVLNNETGILVPPYEPQSLAEALYQLYTNKDKRIRMGQLGYDRAKNEFSSERYTKDISDLYLKLYSQLKDL